MKHLNEEDLILIYYAEVGAPAEAQAHLARCAACRSAEESLAQTLRLCNDWTAPERPAEFGRDTWNRLIPALDVLATTGHLERKQWWGGWSAARSLGVRSRTVRIGLVTAGVALSLAAVFLAGRLSRPAVPVMAGLSDHARERIVAIAAADHLDRVRMLLTEIENDGGTDVATLTDERERAENLVRDSRLMRESLAAMGENATTNFLDDVDTVLTETAHTPADAPSQEVHDLRERIESASLLFKVRIVESNLRNEEQKL